MRSCFLLLCFLIAGAVSAQQVYFSQPVKEEDENINFEILGKADSVYVIYKKVRWKHIISCYDREMHLVSGRRLDFIPEKAIQVDPILLNGYVFLVYQYQKGSTVYCMGVKTDYAGNKLSPAVLLDTTRVSQLSDNKIYSTLYSESRQRLMIYKMHLRSGLLNIKGKLFNESLEMIDSSLLVTSFDDRKEYVSDPVLSNDGTFLFAKQFRNRSSERFNSMITYLKKPDSADYVLVDVPMDKKLTDDINIKPDNVNGSFLFNCFYYDEEGKNAEGLFSALLRRDGSVIHAFHSFEDSVRQALSPKDKHSGSLNNLTFRNFFLRRNGGFTLVAENCFNQGLSNSDNWNRMNYLSNYPYSPVNDYYLYNPYFRMYRPPGSYTYFQSTRYFYEEVLVAGMDSALNLKWNTIIRKKQFDDDNENYLSFGNMNMGGELHFLFVEKNDRSSVLNDHSVTPSGKLIRYPPLKSHDKTYSYMPRLAKQVGARDVMIPCSYLGRIVFARMVYNN